MSSVVPAIERIDDSLASSAPATSFGSKMFVVASERTVAPIAALIQVPGSLRFALHLDVRLRFREPFIVRLEKCDEGVAAIIDEIDEFGIGSTPGDALHDLGRTIVELYFNLKSTRALSEDLLNVRAFLEAHIESASAANEGPRIHENRE